MVTARRPLTAEQVEAAERLRGLWDKHRRATGMSQEQAALALGWSQQSAVSQYLNGKIPLNIEATAKFARLLGVTVADIFPSAGKLVTEGLDQNVSAGPAIRGTVPLLSWVQAGPFTSADDPCDVAECDRVATTAPVRQRTFALRVENTSMSPDFPPGTVLIVEPDLDPRVGDYVIVANGAAEATFKQLVRDGDDWMLRPINPQFPVKPMPEHGRIVGVVVAAERKLR